jgi:FkbM family methyltransferase
MNRLVAAARRYHRFRNLRKALAGGASSSHLEPELLHLREWLDPEKAFFDVGANIGEYVYAARKYMPLEKIYAFEPQQTYVDDLRTFFPGLAVERCALSNGAGERKLKIPRIGQALYRTRGTLEDFAEPGEDGAEFEEVPVMTLDQAVEKLRTGAVGCVKIDVEGHERAVLEGASGTLERDRPTLIIEIEQRHHKEPIEDILRWLAQRGYEGRFFDPASGELAPLNRFEAAVHQRAEELKTGAYVRNFLFTRHG